MAEFPALPLFTDSLIADTDHLSHEEFGAYMRILILIWRSPECRIPVAYAWLMRKLRCKDKEFNELFKPLFSEFLTSDGAFYTQKRLFKEFTYQRNMRLKNRGAAKSRWNKEKMVDSGNAPYPTLPQQHNNDPNGSLFNTPQTQKEKKNGKHELPENFEPDATSLRVCTEFNIDPIPLLDEVRDWAKSKRPRYSDWQATFRNCVRRAAKSGKYGQQGKSGYGRESSKIVEAGARVADRYQKKVAEGLR